MCKIEALDITPHDAVMTVRISYTEVRYRGTFPDGSTTENEMAVAFVGRYGQRRARAIVEEAEGGQVLVTGIMHYTHNLRVSVQGLYGISQAIYTENDGDNEQE